MSTITVFTSLSLDGVMQVPARPDEDRRGGFEHGGWAPPYMDEVMGSVAADDGTLARLRLADTKTSATGVIIATYQPAELDERSRQEPTQA